MWFSQWALFIFQNRNLSGWKCWLFSDTTNTWELYSETLSLKTRWYNTAHNPCYVSLVCTMNSWLKSGKPNTTKEETIPIISFWDYQSGAWSSVIWQLQSQPDQQKRSNVPRFTTLSEPLHMSLYPVAIWRNASMHHGGIHGAEGDAIPLKSLQGNKRSLLSASFRHKGYHHIPGDMLSPDLKTKSTTCHLNCPCHLGHRWWLLVKMCLVDNVSIIYKPKSSVFFFHTWHAMNMRNLSFGPRPVLLDHGMKCETQGQICMFHWFSVRMMFSCNPSKQPVSVPWPTKRMANISQHLLDYF